MINFSYWRGGILNDNALIFFVWVNIFGFFCLSIDFGFFSLKISSEASLLCQTIAKRISELLANLRHLG